MAESIKTATVSNPATTDYAFSIKFLDQAHLSVYLNGAKQTLTTHYTLSGSSGSLTVSMVASLSIGDIIQVKRVTPYTGVIDFEAGPLQSDDLDAGLSASLYRTQEAVEEAAGVAYITLNDGQAVTQDAMAAAGTADFTSGEALALETLTNTGYQVVNDVDSELITFGQDDGTYLVEATVLFYNSSGGDVGINMGFLQDEPRGMTSDAVPSALETGQYLTLTRRIVTTSDTLYLVAATTGASNVTALSGQITVRKVGVA